MVRIPQDGELFDDFNETFHFKNQLRDKTGRGGGAAAGGGAWLRSRRSVSARRTLLTWPHSHSLVRIVAHSMNSCLELQSDAERWR